MEFSANAPVLFVLAGIIIAAVLAQSVFFLVKAWRRAREIGMDMGRLKKTARTAAIFTIAPAVAIVISVMTLSKDLGVALPWLRLSVVGSLSYETVAATNAESAMGLVFGRVTALTAGQYVTIAWVMTISILVGIWLVPLISRRILNGMITLENRDRKWAETFSMSKSCTVKRRQPAFWEISVMPALPASPLKRATWMRALTPGGVSPKRSMSSSVRSSASASLRIRAMRR